MTVSLPQIAAFRLQRHHLLQRHSSDLVRICSDICGVQAQVLGAARLALWARASKVVPADIDSALWQKRALVKTSAMRQTLHLLPAPEYHIYIAALRQSRMAAYMKIMARIDARAKEIEAMTAALMKILGDEPVPQRELAEQVKPLTSKKLQASMKLFWNNWAIFRPAIIEGLICFGPQRGSQATLVRVDRWLPALPPITEQESQRFILRKYLCAYGPATLRDFSRWSGISIKEAKPVWDCLADEVCEVSTAGTRSFILRDHLRELESARLTGPVVRLLPSFDPYMLAHADKDHLVDPRYYKRVYRNQGWLSPVVLVNGRVVGIWSYGEKGRKSSVQTELFEKVDRTVHVQIKKESENLVRFAGAQGSDESDSAQ